MFKKIFGRFFGTDSQPSDETRQNPGDIRSKNLSHQKMRKILGDQLKVVLTREGLSQRIFTDKDLEAIELLGQLYTFAQQRLELDFFLKIEPAMLEVLQDTAVNQWIKKIACLKIPLDAFIKFFSRNPRNFLNKFFRDAVRDELDPAISELFVTRPANLRSALDEGKVMDRCDMLDNRALQMVLRMRAISILDLPNITRRHLDLLRYDNIRRALYRNQITLEEIGAKVWKNHEIENLGSEKLLQFLGEVATRIQALFPGPRVTKLDLLGMILPSLLCSINELSGADIQAMAGHFASFYRHWDKKPVALNQAIRKYLDLKGSGGLTPASFEELLTEEELPSEVLSHRRSPHFMTRADVLAMQNIDGLFECNPRHITEISSTYKPATQHYLDDGLITPQFFEGKYVPDLDSVFVSDTIFRLMRPGVEKDGFCLTETMVIKIAENCKTRVFDYPKVEYLLRRREITVEALLAVDPDAFCNPKVQAIVLNPKYLGLIQLGGDLKLLLYNAFRELIQAPNLTDQELASIVDGLKGMPEKVAEKLSKLYTGILNLPGSIHLEEYNAMARDLERAKQHSAALTGCDRTCYEEQLSTIGRLLEAKRLNARSVSDEQVSLQEASERAAASSSCSRSRAPTSSLASGSSPRGSNSYPPSTVTASASSSLSGAAQDVEQERQDTEDESQASLTILQEAARCAAGSSSCSRSRAPLINPTSPLASGSSSVSGAAQRIPEEMQNNMEDRYDSLFQL